SDTRSHVRYRAMPVSPPDYDGRRRPKYVLSARKAGIHWGNPYLDTRGNGLLLPMSTSLYASDGRFLGVAGADTTFGYIAKKLLELPGYDAIEDEYLVDDLGRVVVHAAKQDLTLAPLPYPAALPATKARRNGAVPDGDRLVACYRIGSLGP